MLGGVITMLAGAFHACAWCRSPASRSQQPGQSCEVVGGHGQDEPRTDALDAAIHGLRHATDPGGDDEVVSNQRRDATDSQGVWRRILFVELSVRVDTVVFVQKLLKLELTSRFFGDLQISTIF